MKLQDFAESIAIKVNREESIEFIESLKFDILRYRASIIADSNYSAAPEIYYQYLHNFKVEKNIDLFKNKFELITIPKLIGFKNGKYALKAFNKIGENIKSIDILTLEQLEFIKGRRFTQKYPYLVIDSENKLLGVNFKLSSLNGLVVGGIFNNPFEITTLNSCDNISNCFKEDDLEIEDNLYQKIVIYIYKQLGIENINEIKSTNQ